MKKIMSIMISVIIILGSTSIIAKAEEQSGIQIESNENVNNVKNTKVFGDFKYEETSDGEGVILTEYTGSEENIEIPTMIDNKLVKGIHDKYFRVKDRSFNKVKSVIFKNNKLNTIEISIDEEYLIFTLPMVETITIEDGVETIGDRFILIMPHLKTVKFPKSLKKLGNCNCFNCSQLENININEIENVYIGDDCFYGSKWLDNEMNANNGMYIYNKQLIHVSPDLTDINIPEGVEVINGGAVREGTEGFIITKNNLISSVEFPSTLKKIKSYAFSADNLPHVFIPENVEIEENAFSSSTWVKREGETLTEEEKNYFFDREKGIIYKYFGEEPVVTFPSYIKGIKVKQIGVLNKRSSFSFENYYPVIEKADNINKVIISDGIEQINGQAFENCSRVTQVSIPRSVNVIYSSAFNGCEKLNNIIIPNKDVVFKDANDWDNIVSKLDCTATVKIGCDQVTKNNFIYEKETGYITGYTGNEETVTIPTEIDGIKIIGICGEQIFKNATSINKVIIPEGIKTLGDKVFNDCSNISEIELPTSLVNIGKHVFDGTTWINNKYSNEKGMLIINNQLISCSKDATKIEIPETVTSIKSEAFNGCDKLTSISIKGTISTLGETKFSNDELINQIKDQVSPECVVTDKDKQIKVTNTIDINNPNKYLKMMLGAILLFGGIMFGKKDNR